MAGSILAAFGMLIIIGYLTLNDVYLDQENAFFNLLGQNWFQGLLSVLAIIVTIAVYMHEQTKLRKETIIRSCEAILREIQENVESLTGGKYDRIVYPSGEHSSSSVEEQKVNYTNAYLDSDAYESVLFSGSFTHFSAVTQHTLTMLYGRIHKRNEMISYVEHLEDTFFMNTDSSSMTARKERWFKTVMKYDTLITRYEKEIHDLLRDVRPMITEEKLKQKSTFLRLIQTNP